jgi:hypothetical protein
VLHSNQIGLDEREIVGMAEHPYNPDMVNSRDQYSKEIGQQYRLFF